MLHDGLYEQIINKGLDSELAETDQLSQTAPIDVAEASRVLAKYVAEVVERGLENLKDNGGDLNAQVALANQIITTIKAETKEADFDSLSVAERAEQLLALFDRQNSIWAVDEKAQVIRPETSIAQSSLFTGAVHEPQMYTELKKEIVSCNRIDMLVSFHWQSQSTTAERSSTGQRYIHHKEMGSRVLLFVREFKADRITNGAEAYTYLGTANYVKHEGEKPMNITWRLDAPIPAKYLKKTNKLVVG